MDICKYCQAELPDQAAFCGHCGQRVDASEQTSTNSVTIPGLITPILDEREITAAGETFFPNGFRPGQEKRSGEQPIFRPHPSSIEHTLPVAPRNNKEEDDDAKMFPFFFVQPPAGNAPMVPGAPQAGGVPFVGTPPPAGNFAQAAQATPSGAGQGPFYTQPASPWAVPPASPSPTPYYFPQPPQPPRPRPAHLLRPTCLVILSVIIIAASIIFGLTLIFLPRPPVPLVVPSVGLAGMPTPGQSMILYGNNFVPGETVIITIDTTLQASARSSALVPLFQSMNIGAAAYTLPQARQITPLRYTTTVASNGTFSKPIFIDTGWPIGSNHTAYVYKQNGKLIRPLHFQVRSTLPAAHTGLQGCPSQAASISIGSAQEGSRLPVSKTIILCTKGSGIVRWTARWDQPWLQLSHSGLIHAPLSAQLSASASALHLKHGIYRTSVVFTSKQSNAKIVIGITFVVSQAPPPPGPSPSPQPLAKVQCISTDSHALYFNDAANQNNTLPQWITIANCGDTGNWSASTSTTDGSNWLGLTSANGTLQRGGIAEIAITANSARLSSNMYTGNVTFRMGSSTAVVVITFRVHSGPICVSVSRQSLMFSSVAGETAPSPQELLLTNCGSAAVHWSALPSTDDGEDWLHFSSSSYNLPPGGSQRVSIFASSTLLDLGEFTGKITFVMGAFAKSVNVSLTVGRSCIQPLSQSLTFTSTEQQADTASQRITLLNCGTAAGQWLSAPTTGDGTNWLSIDPSNGYLQKNASQKVSITVSTAHLSSGIYTGRALFGMGNDLQAVQVTLIIKPKSLSIDCIKVSNASLSFTSTVGQGDPDPQTLTIFNCGRTTGQWFSSLSTDDHGKWLSIDLSKGTLGSGDTQVISVMPTSTHLTQGTHNAQLTFGIGSSMKQVQVTFSVQSSPSPACIQVDQSALTFQITGNSSTAASYNIAAASIPNEGSGPLTLHIKNCGDEGTLATTVNTIGNLKWLSTALTDASLKKQATTSASVTANPTNLIAGTYTGTITFTITTHAGTTNTYTVNVTMNILPPSSDTSGCIQPSPSSLTFTSTWGQDIPPAQNVTLTNCGPDTSWTEADTANGSLYLSSTNGSLKQGGSQTISIQQINGQVLPGTYTEPITFTTDDGAIATVNVTWNIKPPSSPVCIAPSSTALSFTMIEGVNTGELVDYFSNCGVDAGQISVVDTGNANWLTIGSLPGSSMNSPYVTGDGPSITADVNDANLQPGTYTDNINATITTNGGSKLIAVAVTLLVLQQPTAPTNVSTPTATSTPTTAPGGQPMLLVAPTSFDPSSCTQNNDGSWTCTTTLSVDASAPGSVNWSASSPDLAGVTFSPSGDLLYPGQQESVAINVPASACYNGTFTFTTDAGITSSATWSCFATPTAMPTATPTATTPPSSQPTPQLSPTAFDTSSCVQNSDGSWTCSATLSLDPSAQSSVNWSASSPDLSGVSFSPANGNVSPGQQVSISIYVPASDCTNGTFTITTDSGATTSATWSCAGSPPTITPTDTPTDTPTAVPPTPTDTPTPLPPTPTDTPTAVPPTPTDTPTSLPPTPTDTPTPLPPPPTDTPTPGP